MTTLFFGSRWDAPRVDEAIQISTPVGMTCFHCEEPIRMGERGLLMPVITHPDRQPSAPPVHMECDLRMATGDLAHLRSHCICTGYDGPTFACSICGAVSTLPSDIENQYCGACHAFPPPMTRHQEARLVEAWIVKNWRNGKPF